MQLFPSSSGPEFFWGLKHQPNKIPTSCVTWTTHIISSCLRFLIHKMNLYGDRTGVMEEVGGMKEIWLSQYHVFVQWPWVSAPVVSFVFEFWVLFIFWNKWFFRNVFCKHFLIFWICFFLLWTMSSTEQKFLILMKSNFSNVLANHALVAILRNWADVPLSQREKSGTLTFWEGSMT